MSWQSSLVDDVKNILLDNNKYFVGAFLDGDRIRGCSLGLDRPLIQVIYTDPLETHILNGKERPVFRDIDSTYYRAVDLKDLIQGVIQYRLDYIEFCKLDLFEGSDELKVLLNRIKEASSHGKPNSISWDDPLWLSEALPVNYRPLQSLAFTYGNFEIDYYNIFNEFSAKTEYPLDIRAQNAWVKSIKSAYFGIIKNI